MDSARSKAAPSRTAMVPAARLAGWVERFAASHGSVQEEPDDGGLLLRASDGATALLQAPWPDDGRPGRGADGVERLISLASQERKIGLVLVRRGGFAVGVASGGKILASKTGSRYVQSRSSAGGSSQQRFARRRANQADALISAAAAHAAIVFAGHAVEYLLPGGDAALAAAVLADPALRDYAQRSRLPFVAVPDPNAGVLRQAAADACSLRILVTDPA
ncbi:acVLRF1 family peptidyl-tRNA hydrolase [Arthrobacter celericrescens]|uniref:acVLRF1 family peptidyl-tRNA hydrolase n=1 Tax=Arthrobacter celericrescens TaxID=2320851 RepID=UPI000EA39EF4|nr:acVLRF1 family peptidyl-tRNA hydrolase [Arthrobacter celericrescens]